MSYRHSSPSSTYYDQSTALAPAWTSLAALTTLILLGSITVVFLVWPHQLYILTCHFTGLYEMATFNLQRLAHKLGRGSALGDASDSVNHSEKGPILLDDDERPDSSKERHQDTTQGQQPHSESGPAMYPGLLNAAGNLCFLNATLQAMASLPSLLAYLKALTANSSTSSPPPVATALLATLSALNTPSYGHRRPSPLRPSALATALAQSSPTRRRLLASSEQQDAQELWLMIKEAVEDEAAKVLKDRTSREMRQASVGLGEVVELAATDKRSDDGFSSSAFSSKSLSYPNGKSQASFTESFENAFNESRRTAGRRRTKLVGPRDPWLLLTSQRVRCMTCGYTREVTLSTDAQVSLSVPAVTSCSLHDLLSEHTKVDVLSDYSCRRCSVQATLDKYVAQRDRLKLGPAVPAGTTSDASKISDKSGDGRGVNSPSSSSASSNKFDLPASTRLRDGEPKPTATMTASRRDRLRKVQKIVSNLEDVVRAADFEQPLGDEIKMERVFGAAGKMIRFARTPDVLVLHLQRSMAFGGGYSGASTFKNSCQVRFPHVLDLGHYSDHPPSSNADADEDMNRSTDTYRLASLVVHYGSHHFGHYVAYRRAPSDPRTGHGDRGDDDVDDWYRVSDETVARATLDEALRGNPFLLFYERVQGRRNPDRDSREQCVAEVKLSGSVDTGNRVDEREVAAGLPTAEGVVQGLSNDGTLRGVTSSTRARTPTPRVVQSWRVGQGQSRNTSDKK